MYYYNLFLYILLNILAVDILPDFEKNKHEIDLFERVPSFLFLAFCPL